MSEHGRYSSAKEPLAPGITEESGKALESALLSLTREIVQLREEMHGVRVALNNAPAGAAAVNTAEAHSPVSTLGSPPSPSVKLDNAQGIEQLDAPMSGERAWSSTPHGAAPGQDQADEFVFTSDGVADDAEAQAGQETFGFTYEDSSVTDQEISATTPGTQEVQEKGRGADLSSAPSPDRAEVVTSPYAMPEDLAAGVGAHTGADPSVYTDPFFTPHPETTPVPQEPEEPFGEQVSRVLEQVLNKGMKVAAFLGVGNLWVLAGVAILFLGVVFLVRQAASAGLIGPELRVAGAASVGIALLGLGWYLRIKRADLGLILQGGGVGSLYLTVVGAVQLYDMLPFLPAFGLLLFLVALSTYLALLQDSRIMAHVANVAGFASPILISTGGGNYIGLFGYYILLNFGIIAVSRFRSWRSLYLTGFVCTSLIGFLWGYTSYSPEMFLPVQGFLVAFFLIFTYLSLQGSLPGAKDNMRNRLLAVDVPLTVCTPLFFLLFQTALAKGKPFVLAGAVLLLSLLYLGITQWLRKYAYSYAPQNDSEMNREEFFHQVRAQAETYLVYGVIAANLALPLALSNLEGELWRERALTLIWSLEAAALVWAGRKHRKLSFCALGLCCAGLAALGNLALITRFPIGMLIQEMGDGISYMTGDTVRPYSLATAINFALHLISAAGIFAAGLAIHLYPWNVNTRGIDGGVEGEAAKGSTQENDTKKNSTLENGNKDAPGRKNLLARFYGLFTLLSTVFHKYMFAGQARLAAGLFGMAGFFLLLNAFSELRTVNSLVTSVAISLEYGIASLQFFKIWPCLLAVALVFGFACDYGAKRFCWPAMRLGSLAMYLPLGVILLAFIPYIALMLLGARPFNMLFSMDPAIEGGTWELSIQTASSVLFCIVMVLSAAACDIWRVYRTGMKRLLYAGPRLYLCAGLGCLFLSCFLVFGLSLQPLLSTRWLYFAMLLTPLAALFLLGRAKSPWLLLAFHRGQVLPGDRQKRWEDFPDTPARTVIAGTPGTTDTPFMTGTPEAQAWQGTDGFSRHAVFTGGMRQALKRYWCAFGFVPAVMAAFWFVMSIFSSGDAAPLPYIPLLNPVDFGYILVFATLYHVKPLLEVLPGKSWAKSPMIFWGAAFVLTHISIARFCLYWGGMDFSLQGAFTDSLYQALVAILWGVTGFTVMLQANRSGSRFCWMLGMGLMLCDIAKLFLFDLTRMGATWRVMAFMGVGVILICTGYFVPMPPKKVTASEATDETPEGETPAQNSPEEYSGKDAGADPGESVTPDHTIPLAGQDSGGSAENASDATASSGSKEPS